MLLQRILFPKDFNSFVPSLFYHTKGTSPIYIRDGKGSVNLGRIQSISFDTWFNIFSLSKWRRYCSLSELFFRFKGQGSATLRFYKVQRDCSPKVFFEKRINEEALVEIPIEDINYSHIFAELVDTSDDFSISEESGFYSNQKPLNKISMVAVITHFNRKRTLLPTLSVLSNEIVRDPLLRESLKVVVVDNSSNITQGEVENLINVQVVPNQNFGGSGGYAKGLMYAKKLGATHCLFTDDDVNCEIESIRRTLVVLSLTSKKNLAIIGAILSEENPRIAIQAGAKFTPDGWLCQSASSDLDTLYGAVFQDSQLASPDFGAWPFFAFPVAEVQKFPFPFFVRGDDVLFGLENNFSLCTFNGIGVSVENIVWREGPSSLYQDVRAILVVNLKKGTEASDVLNYLDGLVSGLINSYKYASARAVLLAVQDVMKGPRYFRDNLTNQDAREKLRPLVEKESFRPAINVSPDVYPQYNLGLVKRAQKKFKSLLVTFLPGIIKKNGAVYQDKGLTADFSVTFEYKKIFYYCSYNNSYLITEFSRREAVEIGGRFRTISKQLKRSYPSLIREYQNSSVGSEADWIAIYGDIRTL